MKKNLSGSMHIWTIVLTLIFFIILAFLIQVARVAVIAKDVKAKVSSAVIAVAQDNYPNIYASARDGYTGAYKFDEASQSWKVNISKGDVWHELESSLGIVRISNNRYSQYAGSNINFNLSELKIQATGSRWRSAGDTIERFKADTEITLEIPLFFAGEELTPLKIKLLCKSDYTIK